MGQRPSSFWLFLILGVAVGLSFELIKSPKVETSRFAFFHVDEEADADGPVSGRSRIRKHIIKPSRHDQSRSTVSTQAPHAGEVAGLESPDHVAPNAEEVKAAADKAAGVNENKTADKKAEDKKAQDKKKKKKKKTVDGKPGQPQPTAQNSAQDDGKSGTSGDTSAGEGAEGVPPMAGYYAGLQTHDENWIPQTLEEWEMYLFEKPDFHRTSRFIKFYQSGVVKSEVFYAVVEHMLADDDMKVREYGVLALGNNPSATSFKYLVHVTHNEDRESPARKQAYLYLRTYTQSKYLPLLVSALSADNNAETHLEAIRLLDLAANYYLTHRDQPSGGQTGNGNLTQQGETPRTPAGTSLSRQFDSFVPALQRVAATSQDSSVRTAAGQAASNIQNLLGRS